MGVVLAGVVNSQHGLWSAPVIVFWAFGIPKCFTRREMKPFASLGYKNVKLHLSGQEEAGVIRENS